MPTNMKYLAHFHESRFYHIYNRSNNRESLFRTEENMTFFLRRYFYFLSNYVDTYCWTLLPNHFHFLIRVKPKKEIDRYLKSLNPTERCKTEDRYLSSEVIDQKIHLIIDNQFKRLFISYANAFNNRWRRYGNLFQRPFKRIEVEGVAYLTYLLYYIHKNCEKHAFHNDFNCYEWSSYSDLVSGADSRLSRKEVLRLFGGLEGFKEYHDSEIYFQDKVGILLEHD